MNAESLTPDAPEPLQDFQAQAASDLLGRLSGLAPRRIGVLREDAGSARTLLEMRFSHAAIEGLDASPSDETASAPLKEPLDLIHSNGDLEWRPALRRLLPKLVSRLRPGGCLAAQFPDDLYEPYRVLARLVAADGPWAKTLLPVAKTRPFNTTMEGLYALLSPVCSSVDLWETTYLHALGGADAIVDAMQGGALTPFLAPLDPRSRDDFLDRYRDELRLAYPPQPDGAVLMRLPRIFVLAQR